MARAMLHTAALGPALWELATQAACYVHNRIFHAGVNGIPTKLITGKQPDLSHLGTFGCPAYVHIPPSHRLKMQLKAFKGIFLGYPTNSPGYLVYNPATRRVIVTRHVTFDE